jgi:hypothetical protein
VSWSGFNDLRGDRGKYNSVARRIGLRWGNLMAAMRMSHGAVYAEEGQLSRAAGDWSRTRIAQMSFSFNRAFCPEKCRLSVYYLLAVRVSSPQSSARCPIWKKPSVAYGGTAVFPAEICSMLECALWHVRELAGHHAGSNLRYSGPISNYSSGS